MVEVVAVIDGGPSKIPEVQTDSHLFARRLAERSRQGGGCDLPQSSRLKAD